MCSWHIELLRRMPATCDEVHGSMEGKVDRADGKDTDSHHVVHVSLIWNHVSIADGMNIGTVQVSTWRSPWDLHIT